MNELKEFDRRMALAKVWADRAEKMDAWTRSLHPVIIGGWIFAIVLIFSDARNSLVIPAYLTLTVLSLVGAVLLWIQGSFYSKASDILCGKNNGKDQPKH